MNCPCLRGFPEISCEIEKKSAANVETVLPLNNSREIVKNIELWKTWWKSWSSSWLCEKALLISVIVLTNHQITKLLCKMVDLLSHPSNVWLIFPISSAFSFLYLREMDKLQKVLAKRGTHKGFVIQSDWVL